MSTSVSPCPTTSGTRSDGVPPLGASSSGPGAVVTGRYDIAGVDERSGELVMTGNVANHVGLCVRDLARSRTFYEEGLGFTFRNDLRPPDRFTAPLLGVDSPGLTAVYLTLGSFVLELLHFDREGNPPPRTRSFNEPGLTHLSVTVPDLARAVELVSALGGEPVEGTDIGMAIMVRDPDGQLIELLSAGP